MRKLALILGAAATLSAAIGAPTMADAHHHHYYHHARYGSGCQRAERRSGTTGAVVGGVGGALAGNAIGHGSLGGTLLGAGAGALVGHKLGQDSHNC